MGLTTAGFQWKTCSGASRDGSGWNKWNSKGFCYVLCCFLTKFSKEGAYRSEKNILLLKLVSSLKFCVRERKASTLNPFPHVLEELYTHKILSRTKNAVYLSPTLGLSVLLIWFVSEELSK